MRAPPTEQRQVVWEVVAQLWVDTSYDAKELDEFADRLAGCGFSMTELDRIATHEVCGAFATFTLAVFASAGMALPDWHFPKDQARKLVAEWLSRPRFLSLLNPFWIAGYVAARSFLGQTWRDSREESLNASARLPSNMRLKLSARGRRLCRNAQWEPSFSSAAPAGRSLSATR